MIGLVLLLLDVINVVICTPLTLQNTAIENVELILGHVFIIFASICILDYKLYDRGVLDTIYYKVLVTGNE